MAKKLKFMKEEFFKHSRKNVQKAKYVLEPIEDEIYKVRNKDAKAILFKGSLEECLVKLLQLEGGLS